MSMYVAVERRPIGECADLSQGLIDIVVIHLRPKGAYQKKPEPRAELRYSKSQSGVLLPATLFLP